MIKQLKPAAALLAGLLFLAGCGRTATDAEENSDEIIEPNLLYGIPADNYRLEQQIIARGETLGQILNRYGVSAAQIDQLDKASKDVFPLRNIRAGRSYTAFIHEDSLNAPHLDYLVYEQSISQYVVFSLADDSISVTKGEKEYEIRRQKKTATIDSSLWEAIVGAGMPASLAAEMEDIYQSTISFFSIQKGDNFTVIYDERYIDTLPAGIGRIWGAKFNYGGKTYYAIPFRQGNKIAYWDQDGNSLRKLMLITPLKYTRISSRFTYSRLHPIYKTYRAHTGVDFAAPKGTPVHAVADGTVIFKGWGGGGGNTLKIKHNNGFMTGYLHLSGYAKGIRQGSRVSQGQLIGYVGSTGASTGPHLDYRVWRNGKPIDPLKIPQEPGEPIHKANRAAYEYVRDRIMAELDGEVKEEDKIKQLDSIVLTPSKTADSLVFSSKL